MKKTYLEAILSPATANAVKLPGSLRVLNCHLPADEKRRIVRQRKWEGLIVDIEHDARAVGTVERTWLGADGSIWGRLALTDPRGEAYVRSLRERLGRMPEISLTICYAGDQLPGNSAYAPMTASDFNKLLGNMGGAVIDRYEARGVSLVERGDVPCSLTTAITFASGDGTSVADAVKLGRTYVINRGMCVDKDMNTQKTDEKATPAPAAGAQGDKAADGKAGAPPVDINDDDTPYFTKRQAINLATQTKARLDNLTLRTNLLPMAIDVLMNEELNERQKRRLSDFVAEPATYKDFDKVAMFLEDFDDPPADEPAAGAAGAAKEKEKEKADPKAGAEKKDEKPADPVTKRRRLNNSMQAANMMRTPADTKKDAKKPAAPPVPDALKSMLDAFGIDENSLNNRVSDNNFEDRIASMLGGITNPAANKVAA